jgi:hypothetical protein
MTYVIYTQDRIYLLIIGADIMKCRDMTGGLVQSLTRTAVARPPFNP